MQEARSAIVGAIAADPLRTMSELAALSGVSRQRVHQILKAEGLKAATDGEVRRARGIVVKPRSRMEIRGPAAGISHSAAGTVAEMLVAADMITRGWSVFFPLVRTTKCDLLALSSKGRRTKRIEVRSGIKKKGVLGYNKKPSDVCDHHAVVVAGEPIIFLPEIELGTDD